MRAALSWAPALAWAGVIFAFSAVPGLKSPWDAWDYFLRKNAHVFEYAVLAFLIARGLRATGPRAASPWVPAFLLAALYAVSDEFHQSFVPGRGPSPLDIGFDALGAALGAWVHRRRTG